ncbi:DUF4886 domain-containing protein [uncultured Duncaniella sp.]|uniref:DUF4886 domain-containing protein n=2 Tax=uncultured Duncaniella sp. TaxID=2768039 RepID=UPI00265B49DE|nr:DUF4886 domain-containing protein [uncultured Duncaniella sp.]
MRITFKLFIISILLATVSQAQAATIKKQRAAESDSTQVLFIGNSFTFYNDMPEMMRRLASTLNLKIAPSRSLKGGQTFEGHLMDPFLLGILKDGGFDYVVMHDASHRPSYSTKDVMRDVYPYAHKIDSLAKAGSPNVKTIYYMTWGHKDGIRAAKRTDYPLNHTYHGMQQRLNTSYLEMAHENGGICAPVGMAWERVVNERPDIDLFSAKDRYHPSKEGSYLAACTILSTILGKPFVSPYYAGLPEEVALYLQKTAGETVADNLALIGIKQ